jgi:hypothetical protein
MLTASRAVTQILICLQVALFVVVVELLVKMQVAAADRRHFCNYLLTLWWYVLRGVHLGSIFGH